MSVEEIKMRMIIGPIYFAERDTIVCGVEHGMEGDFFDGSFKVGNGRHRSLDGAHDEALAGGGIAHGTWHISSPAVFETPSEYAALQSRRSF